MDILTIASVGYKQQVIIDCEMIKRNGVLTIRMALDAIHKAKHKRGAIFDVKG